MKANRKFLNGDDEAVSPVIAVILMVAITVVLAATVYVWVSGFGSQSGSPAKSLALSSNGPLNGGEKSYTVASATSGMKYGDIKITINGADYALDTTGGFCDDSDITASANEYVACGGTTDQTATSVIDAGEIIHLSGLTSGQTLRMLDASANSVILTLTVG